MAQPFSVSPPSLDKDNALYMSNSGLVVVISEQSSSRPVFQLSHITKPGSVDLTQTTDDEEEEEEVLAGSVSRCPYTSSLKDLLKRYHGMAFDSSGESNPDELPAEQLPSSDIQTLDQVNTSEDNCGCSTSKEQEVPKSSASEERDVFFEMMKGYSVKR